MKNVQCVVDCVIDSDLMEQLLILRLYTEIKTIGKLLVLVLEIVLHKEYVEVVALTSSACPSITSLAT